MKPDKFKNKPSKDDGIDYENLNKDIDRHNKIIERDGIIRKPSPKTKNDESCDT